MADPAGDGASWTGVPSDGGPLVVVDDIEAPRLSADDHHHLARVRRIRDGAGIVLTDARGSWRRALMAAASPDPVGDVEQVDAPTRPVAVAFALVKGSKPELVVQKLTELGVDRIVPFVAARSVVSWDQARAAAAHDRFARVAREAIMQSRRVWMPTIDPVSTFDSLASEPGACRADMGGSPPSLDHRLVMVGPEGGWDDRERSAELPTVALADGVLRAETAAIVAGALLVGLRSGLVGRPD